MFGGTCSVGRDSSKPEIFESIPDSIGKELHTSSIIVRPSTSIGNVALSGESGGCLSAVDQISNLSTEGLKPLDVSITGVHVYNDFKQKLPPTPGVSVEAAFPDASVHCFASDFFFFLLEAIIFFLLGRRCLSAFWRGWCKIRRLSDRFRKSKDRSSTSAVCKKTSIAIEKEKQSNLFSNVDSNFSYPSAPGANFKLKWDTF